MTTNHDYNMPAEGETNWEVPLNENFSHLEVDVEIRDSRSNRGSYEPKQGAKFLAVDTGEVYVGDGSDWQLLGEISPSGGGTTESGAIVAERGSLQSALDSASAPADWAHNTRTVVKLKSGVIYEPSSTVVVGQRTILDGNGALIKPTHGGTVLEVGGLAELRNVSIDARQTGWPNSDSVPMVHVDTGFTGESATGWMGGTPVSNCTLAGPPGTGNGTGMLLEDSAGEGMGGFPISGEISGFTRQLHMKASGGSAAFVNGIKAQVRLRNHHVGIKQEMVSGAACNGNFFNTMGTQPSGSQGQWLWDAGPNVERNLFMGPVWDTQFYEDETAVRFGSNTWNNVVFDTNGFLGDWQVVNNGDDTNGVGRVYDNRFQRNQ